MSGNVVPVIPTPKGQYMVFFNGIMLPATTKVKIPAQEHGVTTVHPGGRATPISVPSGNTKWEDLQITEVRTRIPSPLRVWHASICDGMTGFGIAPELASQFLVIVDTDSAGIPLATFTIMALPFKRDPGDREGGSDDAVEIVMDFKVNMQTEV
jgi:hypothetical protein